STGRSGARSRKDWNDLRTVGAGVSRVVIVSEAKDPFGRAEEPFGMFFGILAEAAGASSAPRRAWSFDQRRKSTRASTAGRGRTRTDTARTRARGLADRVSRATSGIS